MRRRRWLSKGRSVVAAVALAVAAGITTIGPAQAQEANVITVTTTLDGLVNDFNCTLREAIEAANTDTAVDACAAGDIELDHIQLPSGTYSLTVGGTNENANATGDLDILCTASLIPLFNCDEQAAGELVIEPTPSAATPPVIESLTGDRVFHKLPDIILGTPAGSLVSTVPVTIRGVFIRGGASTATGSALLHEGNGTLTLENVTVTGGSAPSGGGIHNEEDLVIVNSAIYGNTATEDGGGILSTNESGDFLQIRNSTVSGNIAGRDGGGIWNSGTAVVAQGDAADGGNLTTNNLTLAGNTAAGKGGGMVVGGGAVTLANSIIADNTAQSGMGPDCLGIAESGGTNLVENTANCTLLGGTGDITGVDPNLGPLASNGGLTLNHAIAPDSPARDKGNALAPGTVAGSCEATDQRGAPRTVCDIGGYELHLCEGAAVETFGTAEDDVIVGTVGADVIQAFAGNDQVRGGPGADLVCAGDGDDEVLGEGDTDVLNGGSGDDTLIGGDGDDVLIGRPGDDRLIGNRGNDRCIGGTDDDLCVGGEGDDTCLGSTEDDTCQGEQGDDLCRGQEGDDVCFGGPGDDICLGGIGRDECVGGTGTDTCNTGPGKDRPYRSCEN